MTEVKPLEADALYQHTDPDLFEFQSTDDIKNLEEPVGQPRAIEAVRFGTGIDQAGYNIYAMGPAGTGKRSLVQRHFEERARHEPVPPDWVYVQNFSQPSQPSAIRLQAGQGEMFQKDMEAFVEELRTTLSAALDSDEYRARRQVIEQKVQEQQEQSVENIQEKAREEGFALIRTPAGLVFAPMREGEVLSPEEFQNLPEEERKRLENSLEELQEELKGVLATVPRVQRDLRERMRELNREITDYAVGALVNELKRKYADNEAVVKYLDEVQDNVVENANDLIAGADQGQDGGEGNLMAMLMQRAASQQENTLKQYQVNLLIDHDEQHGAPVIFEDNPTYQNLIGRVEHMAQMGALVTDFTLIRPGALHRANGGYLILETRKLLQQPYAWEALKRVLQSGQIKIESIGQMLSIISTVSLEPEPIPLNVKIALVGDRLLYYLLMQYEPEFSELFKVQADFEEQMNRDAESQKLYARLIATLVHENKLKAFNREAVARVIEHSARLVGDAERLSTSVDNLANLLREAHYWSKVNGNGVVTAEDVQKAIDAQIYRADRLRERVFETILRGTFLIDTTGEEIGQVNGLSVIQLGDFAFGRPSRITASVRLGKGDVVNIEREVDLSGPIHSKGVLILSGFMGGRYARDKPLSLSASLVFEQSYGGVDGDSASSAELYALLSAIAEVPIRQSFAVTGSINQHGQVQAIGGVNEKIEGFFDICKARGLTGEQGVLIPAANIKHLMLRADVRETVAAGKFRIFPVEHVDQGIEILTGIPAGQREPGGTFPDGTVNGMVQKRLEELVEKQKELAEAAGKENRE